MHGNNQTSRAAEPPMYESEVETSEYRGHSPKIPNLEVDNKSATRDNEQQVLHADKQPVLHHLDAFKETSHGSTAPATAHKAVDEFRAKQGLTVNTNKSGNNKTLSETVTAMLVPANNMVSDATNLIASKIQKPTARDETGAKMVSDKGISVKEYLRNKLEPGEEDRALSEVITDAISSRKGSPRQGGETSVVEKVREAASTLLRKEEPLDAKTTRVARKPHQQDLAPIQTTAGAHQKSSPMPLSPTISVPTNSHSGGKETATPQQP